MKAPQRLQPLIEDGLIDEVLHPLMSGKEADIFVVRCGEHIRCAKVYKAVHNRSFKKAAEYQEGRKVRNSRRARAMGKGSRFGRQQMEDTWQQAEYDTLLKLARAGVRVPEPYGCFDGVLLMELVTSGDGDVAPRLNDVLLSEQQALEDHAIVIQYVVRMLCEGIVHGDLSEFNILVDDYGPVIIDLPQAVNAAANNNAQKMLTRDINKVRSYYAQYAPAVANTAYAKEIWALYEDGELTTDTPLTGTFAEPTTAADVDTVMDEIRAVLEEQEALKRRKEQEQDD